MNSPRRGEIWLVDWSPSRGSEQAGSRPALVLQTDAANSNPRYPNTIVCALSTKGRDIPFHIQLEPHPRTGLSSPSYCKCEQILTISKERLVRRLGNVEDGVMKLIEEGVRLVLDC